ncbi:MAG: Fe-S cluster protein [Candidatus Omnitrophica bacterium]|nr:Fe-S cluster protein [Candidatus Omnitrophota bacterium]
MPETILTQLPGLDCGSCGQRTCQQFAQVIAKNPQETEKCIHLNAKTIEMDIAERKTVCEGCATDKALEAKLNWKDSLGREFDFILDTFPHEPGPRETIIPHNPARTKELELKQGDIIIGRPMGMSCGCPITHCGVVMSVDYVNGVIVWCVTGPLNPRAKAQKDIGYYSAQAYDGLVRAHNKELKIGMRYWFLPHRCMLQWRHSGLVNFINKRKEGIQIRVEGLLIG